MAKCPGTPIQCTGFTATRCMKPDAKATPMAAPTTQDSACACGTLAKNTDGAMGWHYDIGTKKCSLFKEHFTLSNKAKLNDVGGYIKVKLNKVGTWDWMAWPLKLKILSIVVAVMILSTIITIISAFGKVGSKGSIATPGKFLAGIVLGPFLVGPPLIWSSSVVTKE